jgi:hypothetical protein
MLIVVRRFCGHSTSGRGVHGEFQSAEEISDSGTGEHLRDMRAQFATFTVRISQTERLEVEERHVGQSHPRMRGRLSPNVEKRPLRNV